jgi:nuclear GTP-binding protein
LNGASLTDLAGTVESTQEQYDEKKEEDISTADGKGIDWIQAAREAVFSKGQSKRIWNELYKVHYYSIIAYIRSSILQTFS